MNLKICGALWRKTTKKGEILTGDVNFGILGKHPIALFRDQHERNNGYSHILLSGTRTEQGSDGDTKKAKYLTVGYMQEQEKGGSFTGYIDLGLGPDIPIDIIPNRSKKDKQADFWIVKSTKNVLQSEPVEAVPNDSGLKSTAPQETKRPVDEYSVPENDEPPAI